jgi:hypothetical protein
MAPLGLHLEELSPEARKEFVLSSQSITVNDFRNRYQKAVAFLQLSRWGSMAQALDQRKRARTARPLLRIG